MGVDFMRRVKKTFTKSWDRARVRLCTPDLFTQPPDCAGHSVAFDLLGESNLKPGDLVTVEKDGADLVAWSCLTPVGRAPNPPANIVKAIDDACGIAKGTIYQVHPVSGVAEITLC